MPKPVWRDPATRRTLSPIEIESHVLTGWRAWRGRPRQAGLVELELSLDGSTIEECSARAAQPHDFSGVFDFDFDAEEVAVELKEEACRRELGVPTRVTRRIAILRPWRPVRVLLNGKADYHTQRWYYLREYHLVLCQPPVPESALEVRFVDLQEDLQ